MIGITATGRTTADHSTAMIGALVLIKGRKHHDTASLKGREYELFRRG